MAGMFRLLRADEIECRIQQIKPNGLVLLLYKDARCDQNILDETVGPYNWEREHSRDNANCTISLWDESKNQWVSKEDTGTESNTEAQKGLASDSFKRAAFNWGIGRELYTAPFIWIKDCYFERKENRVYDRFKVKEIEYTNNAVISKLVIENVTRRAECFWYGSGVKKVENVQPLQMCEMCGNAIKQARSGSELLSPEQIAAKSKLMYGKRLCANCIRKVHSEEAEEK